MLYKKNGTEKLDEALFKNPTAEYRAAPFWAWNCILDKDALMRQIDGFKEMGFGGFHMHTRLGMGTKYLSDEFMSLIKACRDKAEEKEMLAWLYDEDRWPSGSAGGYVTKNKAFRQKKLVFSEGKPDLLPKEEGVKEGKPYLLAAYDIILDDGGFLKSYRVIGENEAAAESTVLARFDFRHGVPYEREEENVYMLDMAEYSVEGKPFADVEEILRIDRICRDRYRFPLADGKDCQPWAIEGDEDTREVRLRFTVRSETAVEKCCLAAEEAREVTFNGKPVALSPCGYYVDESIKKYPLGKLIKGDNIIEITAPIGKRISIESFFLLGDFDVMLRGCEPIIAAPTRTIGFGNAANQGLAFYGGNIVYKTTVTTPAGKLRVQVPRYRCAAVRVALDGKKMGYVAYAPYTLSLGQVEAGEHTVTFTLLGSRVNTFSALHNASADVWYGPAIWYTRGLRKSDGEGAAAWSYEYVLEQTGILSSPIVEVLGE